ncbi:hypothetical protein ASPACDRAFT_1853798 [Aspergillus aculeatus ATCC 16872]|uniref:Uncharacterized protein n=1 Tax=Aspergillus aculeatus (strain ATCC 16872 / CBS 172.66 / WB 5094) TaxID=690307 RepID=A0A1L9X431_ASPA1|nr:uncharacterized protein ASPACDRAFT_1853798 [Aspergillus aculeatus ATCC 16872]OJK03233.1 hypothetical protein ASPACDRAFT_1853798 [Aspergillus aculeatus ATCC 16872]
MTWAVYHYLQEFKGPAIVEYNVAVEICDILFCAKNRLRLQSSTGTLGCWVELQDPETDEWMLYALTSARSVLPTDAHVESCAQKGENTPAFDEWKTYGVPFRDATAARLLVDSPGLYEITMNTDNLDDFRTKV